MVNVFTESGNTGAPFLVSSDKVAVINYTGSTPVGRRIAAAASTTLKRVGLELGGKAPMVILPDADLDMVIPTVVQSLVLMNGQFCCTGSRVLVHRDIADQVRTRLTDALAQVRLGSGDDEKAQLGPVIDRASAQRVDAIVEEAASYGTVLLRGGVVTDGPLAAGAFYRPSLIEVDRTDVRIVQEEVFGPVQTFEIFDDEDDAVTKANATIYGLAASVFSSDSMKARRIARRIRTGTVWINTWGAISEDFEEGGVKEAATATCAARERSRSSRPSRCTWSRTTPGPPTDQTVTRPGAHLGAGQPFTRAHLSSVAREPMPSERDAGSAMWSLP